MGDADVDNKDKLSDTVASASTGDCSKSKSERKGIRDLIEETMTDAKVENTILLLVMIDAIIVIFELLIDLGYLGEDLKKTNIPEMLHYSSITILIIFVGELFMKLFIFRRPFFNSLLNVMDGTIVVISFVVDIAILDEEGWHNVSGFALILRLWRVVRIINGVVVAVAAERERLKEKKEK